MEDQKEGEDRQEAPEERGAGSDGGDEAASDADEPGHKVKRAEDEGQAEDETAEDIDRAFD